MDVLSHYTPLVRNLASGFAKSPEARDDLIQEALIKILQIQRAHPTTDLMTEDWRKQIYVIAKNCMIDHVRKITRRGRFHAGPYEEICEREADANQLTPFEALASEYAVKEILQFLPDLEQRIICELLNPSDEYRWFVRKKRALNKIARKHFFYIPTADRGDFQDQTLAEYLQINQIRFNQAIKTIREAVLENNSNTES